MTVSEEQWAAVAADNNLSVEEMRAQIAVIDARDEVHPMMQAINIPHDLFDRDLDPITMGEWSMLHGATSYRFIAQHILPSRIWIATIWTGLNGDFVDPPLVMESAVFRLEPEREELPPPLHQEMHHTEVEALAAHLGLIDTWGRRA